MRERRSKEIRRYLCSSMRKMIHSKGRNTKRELLNTKYECGEVRSENEDLKSAVGSLHFSPGMG
jgi:hypothetical protein